MKIPLMSSKLRMRSDRYLTHFALFFLLAKLIEWLDTVLGNEHILFWDFLYIKIHKWDDFVGSVAHVCDELSKSVLKNCEREQWTSLIEDC